MESSPWLITIERPPNHVNSMVTHALPHPPLLVHSKNLVSLSQKHLHSISTMQQQKLWPLTSHSTPKWFQSSLFWSTGRILKLNIFILWFTLTSSLDKQVNASKTLFGDPTMSCREFSFKLGVVNWGLMYKRGENYLPSQVTAKCKKINHGILTLKY